MADKPTTLFLIIVAALGTAILSPLTVDGVPVAVLIIPFALAASYLYTFQEGVVVGVVSSIAAGILVASIGVWESVAYALASGVTVYALEVVYPKSKNQLYFLLFAALGTIAFEILYEVYLGDSLLLRSERFLGMSPSASVRVLFNVLATGVLLTFYDYGTAAPAKK